MKSILCVFVFLFICGKAMSYEFVGEHFIASYYECDAEILDDIEKLKEIFLEAISRSNASVLETIEYKFDPQGVTLLALLSESHASIHTYPEERACFVDLFTCGTNCRSDEFDEFFENSLKAKNSKKLKVNRD